MGESTLVVACESGKSENGRVGTRSRIRPAMTEEDRGGTSAFAASRLRRDRLHLACPAVAHPRDEQTEDERRLVPFDSLRSLRTPFASATRAVPLT